MQFDPNPQILTSDAAPAYRLIDSGEGRKLEQVGPYLLDRPEPQAMWPKANPKAWNKVDARFAATDEEGEGGKWQFIKPVPETWPLTYQGLTFNAWRGNFRHIGVFPEQEAQWHWILEQLSKHKKPKLLNVFAYTGWLSVVAANAGAEVTHVDASKKAVMWGKDNQATAALSDKPIRWLVDDARAFLAREVRRGNKYQAIVLDPPKYGRGPDGEVWQFFDDMPKLMADATALLADDARCFVITGYSARLSSRSLAELLAANLKGRKGRISYGECALKDDAGRVLALSLYAAWSAE